MNEQNLEATVRRILDGIDRCEVGSPDGWWETSEGATFGEGKLNELLEALNKGDFLFGPDVRTGMNWEPGLLEAMRLANECLQSHDHGPQREADGEILVDRTNPASCIWFSLELLVRELIGGVPSRNLALQWGANERNGGNHTEWHAPCGCAYHPKPFPHVHPCSDEHKRPDLHELKNNRDLNQ